MHHCKIISRLCQHKSFNTAAEHNALTDGGFMYRRRISYAVIHTVAVKPRKTSVTVLIGCNEKTAKSV